jgi:hypothetical protein
MKWIGQHIVDLIARFRGAVYLEDIDTGTIASGGNLGLDSNNKIVKATEATGDLTGITAGTGLSGTDLTGPVPTLNVDAAQTGITSLGTLSSLAVTSASDLGSSAITLTNADVDQIALDINASNTTANVIDINAVTLTTGSAIKVQGNDQSDESVVLVKVSDNETVSSPGTPRALIEADASKTGVVASTESRLIYGIRSTLSDAATNHANSAVVLTAFKGTVDSASTSGLNYNTGLDLSVTDATYNTGISLLVENGGDDIVMKSSVDTGDLCTIATTTHGATKITTIDDDLAAAHFEIEADGDITLDAAGQIKLEPGTSVLWDSLALTGIQASGESFSDDDVSLMTSAAVNDRIESFGYTTNTGDITGVDLTGTSPINISSETGTDHGDYSATIGIDVASATNKGVVELATTAETTTGTDANRVVTPDGLKDGYQGSTNVTTLGTIATGEWRGTAINATYLDGQSGTNTGDETLASINALDITEVGTIDSGVWQGTVIASAYLDADTAHYSATKQFTHHVFKDDIDTTKHYIGLQEADAENPSAPSKNLPFTAGVAGKLLKVFLRSTGGLSGQTLTWRLETVPTSSNTGSAPTVIGTQSGAGCTNKTMTTYDFTTSLDDAGTGGDNVIDAGDQVLLSIQSSASTTDFIYYVTCLWEWDLG